MTEQRVVAGYGAPIVHLARDGRTLCDRRVAADWLAADRQRSKCRRCWLARNVEREHEFHGGAAGSFASEGCTACQTIETESAT